MIFTFFRYALINISHVILLDYAGLFADLFL